MTNNSTATELVVLSALFHAMWNLVARMTNGDEAVIVLGTAGFAMPVLALFMLASNESHELEEYHKYLAELESPGWLYILISGVSNAAYYVLLAKSYKLGDLSLIYPISRGSGVVFVAVFSHAITKQQDLNLVGAIGIVVVALGMICMAVKTRTLPCPRCFSFYPQCQTQGSGPQVETGCGEKGASVNSCSSDSTLNPCLPGAATSNAIQPEIQAKQTWSMWSRKEGTSKTPAPDSVFDVDEDEVNPTFVAQPGEFSSSTASYDVSADSGQLAARGKQLGVERQQRQRNQLVASMHSPRLQRFLSREKPGGTDLEAGAVTSDSGGAMSVSISEAVDVVLAEDEKSANIWVCIGYAVAVGVCNTVKAIDGSVAVAKVNPVLFMLGMQVVTAVFTVPYMLSTAARRQTMMQAFRTKKLPTSVVGVGAVGTYLIVLYAFKLATNVALVVALRQTSIVFATALGAIVLKESITISKLLGIILITAGVVSIEWSHS
jgi:uncharacterized membrane protein